MAVQIHVDNSKRKTPCKSRKKYVCGYALTFKRFRMFVYKILWKETPHFLFIQAIVPVPQDPPRLVTLSLRVLQTRRGPTW
jgi:hypothetical protein